MPDSLLACVRPINAYLRATVRSFDLPRHVREAVEYALLAGGKRLRPVLAWHSARAAGGRGPESLPGAAAVELVHAFSLVHDDLPAMDDDDLRRGRPTLHRHAGEAMAILAGDLMLSLAFEVLATRVRDAALSTRLTRELARAARAMIVGQVYDTLGEAGRRETRADALPRDLGPRERLSNIHKNKTGALIEAACAMGVVPVLARRPDPRLLRSVRSYSRDIGLMFQIVDDLIDAEQPAQHAGKRTGKDAASGKLTFPGVLGIEASRREIERLELRATRTAERFGARGSALVELARRLAVRSR